MCEEKWMNISKGISCIEDQKAILNYTINKIGKKTWKQNDTLIQKECSIFLHFKII